jgi:hypothetical protein
MPVTLGAVSGRPQGPGLLQHLEYARRVPQMRDYTGTSDIPHPPSGKKQESGTAPAGKTGTASGQPLAAGQELAHAH